MLIISGLRLETEERIYTVKKTDVKCPSCGKELALRRT
jgi:ssDNA-binding Zn-finger/Zn-ribbon topoisomerase 1